MNLNCLAPKDQDLLIDFCKVRTVKSLFSFFQFGLDFEMKSTHPSFLNYFDSYSFLARRQYFGFRGSSIHRFIYLDFYPFRYAKVDFDKECRLGKNLSNHL